MKRLFRLNFPSICYTIRTECCVERVLWKSPRERIVLEISSQPKKQRKTHTHTYADTLKHRTERQRQNSSYFVFIITQILFFVFSIRNIFDTDNECWKAAKRNNATEAINSASYRVIRRKKIYTTILVGHLISWMWWNNTAYWCHECIKTNSQQPTGIGVCPTKWKPIHQPGPDPRLKKGNALRKPFFFVVSKSIGFHLQAVCNIPHCSRAYSWVEDVDR